MHNHLISNEELRLLLTPQSDQGLEAAAAAERTTAKPAALEKRIELLEAQLTEMVKRVLFLEDQLSVRQSAAALALAEAAEARSVAETAIVPYEAERASVRVVELALPSTPLRVDTYKREKKKSWFRN